MAADGEARQEMSAHESSYSLFITVMKWGTGLALAVGAIVILIIGN